MDQLSLSELPQSLNRAGYSSPSYRRIYQAVLDGVLADHIERVNGRWYVAVAAIPKIAEALGLNRTKAAA